MKKTILLPFLTGFLMLILFTSNTTKTASTGAPIGSTGAPGENTCAKSGCHTGNNNINTGTGKLTINIPELNGNYIPGKTYLITINMHQENIKRFGFSFSAYNENTKISAGNLLVTDAQRTQILAGVNQFENREYMTYKAIGTNPYSENNGQWEFEWKAPENANEPITFYVASVAANNDGTDDGDEVYTKEIPLKNYTSHVEKVSKNNLINVYPNPIENDIVFSFNNPKNTETKITIHNINGSKSILLFEGNLVKGNQIFSFEKPSTLACGIYILSILQNEIIYNKKIIIKQ